MIDKKYSHKKDYSGMWTDPYDQKTYSVIKQYSSKLDDDLYEEIVKTFNNVTTSSAPATVKKSEHDRAVQAKHEAEAKAKAAADVIQAMTDGNVDAQRNLIQIDPHNIRYIKNPYVDIQLEAIMADSTCFPRIINPSQEAIDMYRLVK